MNHIKYLISLYCSIALIFFPVYSHAIFSEMTIREERALGLEFDLVMKTQAPLLYDPFIKDYVQSVTDILLQYAPPQQYPFESNVIIDPSLNAFAVPGGFLFLHTGLLLIMESEDELAAIMAHEISHVTQRHIAKRQAQGQKAMLASFIGALALALAGTTTNSMDGAQAGMIGALAAGQSAILSYSRDNESEADNFGFNFMTAAGYNPEAYITSFQKMQAQASLSASIPVYLSTHPGLNERIVNIATRLHSQSNKINIRHSDNSQFFKVQAFVRAQLDTINNAKINFAKMDKEEPMTQLGLGIIHTRDFKFDAAETAYTKLEEIINSNYYKNHKDYAFYLRELGRYNFQYADIQKAYEFLQKAIEINPQDDMAHYFYGRTLSKLDKEHEAQRHFLKINQKYPYDSEIHNLLAHSFAKSGNERLGYLHLAYASLYKTDFKTSKKMRQKAFDLSQNDEQKDEILEFDTFFNKYRSIVES